jgi:branched-chain amino acid transport system permease protein
LQTIKTIVFSVAGAIAGLAGGLYTFGEGFVWPNIVGVILSTQIVLYALFGGVGTLIGPVIDVPAIESVSYALSDAYQQRCSRCPYSRHDAPSGCMGTVN